MSELTTVQENLILHWGEMGSAWGINRATAQIYALLYLSPQAITADEISGTLGIARSTVSTGLRELQNWGLVRVVPVLGDRRDYFEALDDVWEMFRIILRERKRREFDPTLAILRQSAADLDTNGESDPFVRQRLKAMLDFFEAAAMIYDEVAQLPIDTLLKMAEVGGKLGKMLRVIVQE
jgi:DNA-binding transcriptional regulator GbsR (MarR family)